jgi:hypothetical protein
VCLKEGLPGFRLDDWVADACALLDCHDNGTVKNNAAFQGPMLRFKKSIFAKTFGD